MSKRLLAVFMAVLTAALCCSVGLADEAEMVGERGPITRYIDGTYNGYDFSLDATASSSSLIKATGTYGISASLLLKFMPTIAYTNTLGYTVTFTAAENTINYGPYSNTSITKSYSVSQAAGYMYVWYPDGVTYGPLSNILPNNAHFYSCLYKLVINSTKTIPMNVIC